MHTKEHHYGSYPQQNREQVLHLNNRAIENGPIAPGPNYLASDSDEDDSAEDRDLMKGYQ